MACDVAADEPPAIPTVQQLRTLDKGPAVCTVDELGAPDKAPAVCTVQELRAADKAPAVCTVQELRAPDKAPAVCTVKELHAPDKAPAVCTVQELRAGDAPSAIGRDPNLCTDDTERAAHERGDVNRDTNCQNSESNINLEDMDQTFHGNVSEVEDSNIDLTETEASDGMLIDGIRNMLQKSDERKQERRNVLKKQSRKRSRAQMGAAQQCLNKGRASAYSRFSIGYFAKVVDSVCKNNYRMELVRNAGFGYMLEVDDCHVPRPFAQWIADNVSTTDEAIVLRGKSIPLNAEAVSLVLGIPTGSTPISTLDEEIGKTEFLSLFGLTEVPSITFFGNKLLTEELSNEEYIRCFLTVALATFLCPTSNTKPSTKYMGALVDVSNLKNLNWCSFVHDWGMCYVKKYQKDKKKERQITTTLGGCIYHLAVRCLDFNNFGAISIPTVMPRICFWKGQTVKHFSDMLIGKDGLYVALEIKDEVETCYAEKDAAWASTAKNSNIRKAIERVLGNSFPDNVKEDIFLNFQ